MIASSLLASLMAATVVALPNTPTKPSSNPPPSSSQLARFDNDDNAIPLVPVVPINQYLDIFWNGMSLVTTLGSSAPVKAGLVPNSQPNYAAFAVGDVATIQQGTPMMTTVYPDSTVDSFDLNSFYYGCTVGSEESAASVPLPCAMTIEGYNTANKLVAQQTFDFDPGTALLAQMQPAKPNAKFKNLQHVNFSVQPLGLLAILGNATLVGLIDTVGYTVHSSLKTPN